LASYGLTPDDWPDVIEKSAVASSTRANPIILFSNELLEILTHAT
jgi:hypothetical protein